ncbi:MAG: SDR family NAD(P)-dependent oxidoreductase [Rectinemataceae bacterium]
MKTLNDTILPPLVRGLFLETLGKPVMVSPADGMTKASVVLELSTAAIVKDSLLDEEAAAAELKGKFKAIPRSLMGALPVRIDLILGAERLCLEASGFGAASAENDQKAAASSALGRASVVAGKIALVTGGAQGFGAEIVRGLAASGAFVYIADLNIAGAVSLAEELNAAAKSAIASPIAVNVTEEASVAAMFEAIAATTGGLDLIVSNAGVLKASSVLDQDEKSFRFVTDVNYTGFFFMAKHGGRLMRRQWRTAPGWMTDIVQINSKSGLQGSNKNGAYAGSKFGSIGLVQSFALEFVQYGIKVNAICPGNFFDGPLWSDPKNGLFVQYLESGKVPGAKTIADVKAWYEAKVPMGRGATGADVMRAIYYLVEQEYETGQALPVTGGQVMLN